MSGNGWRAKEELFFKAYHESITGYYNWSWMWDRLASYYLQGIKDYGFVHFDIKDFKMINELYNHQVANEVLIRVTENIEAHKDWIYFGARCDNDNFALMIKDMPEHETREKLEKFFDENVNTEYLNAHWEDLAEDYLMRVADDADLACIIDFIR